MYTVAFYLITEDGIEYTQRHENINLDDFEMIYGCITDEIISINLIKTDNNPCNTPITMI